MAMPQLSKGDTMTQETTFEQTESGMMDYITLGSTKTYTTQQVRAIIAREARWHHASYHMARRREHHHAAEMLRNMALTLIGFGHDHFPKETR